MIKGVAKVVPKVADGTDYINRQRIALEIERRLFNVLHAEEIK
jgi:hypothetical protein